MKLALYFPVINQEKRGYMNLVSITPVSIVNLIIFFHAWATKNDAK